MPSERNTSVPLILHPYLLTELAENWELSQMLTATMWQAALAALDHFSLECSATEAYFYLVYLSHDILMSHFSEQLNLKPN